MSLSDYRRKRTFSNTPEPSVGSGGTLSESETFGGRFVVQKHHARNLHYDLRLELGGVLKSWAVPKGPSLDPKVKRLAIHVEDHPIAYLNFEGLIPKGEYGAGPVLVWDTGSWAPVDDDAQKAYEQGELKFELDGHKLQGRWVLVRTARGESDAKHWLLIKERDAHVRRAEDVDVMAEYPASVLSGWTLEDVRNNPQSVDDQGDHVHVSNRGAATEPDLSRDEISLSKVAGVRRTQAIPDPQPSLPTASRAAPPHDDWIHEIKHDGYRMLCYVDGPVVRFVSRNGKDWSDKLPTLSLEVKRLGLTNALLDGEVVMMADDGTTNFQLLQNHIGAGQDAQVRYYLFDLLYLNGYDVRRAKLLDRKQLLRQAAARSAVAQRVLISDHIVGTGPLVLQQACKLGVEGIVSKRIDSRYAAGRTTDWVKTKCLLSDEFVVAGYTLPANNGRGIGALVLARFDEEGSLRYVGRVGTGFSERSLVELREQLDAIQTDCCPIAGADQREKESRWVNPQIVVEIEFAGWTNDRLIRFGVYRGTRDDIATCDVAMRAASGLPDSPASLPPRSATTIETDFDGLEDLKLTNPKRIVYPELGVTKLAVATYYGRVANRMLPFISNRPLSLFRCPKGIGQRCFFQKRAPNGLHGSVQRIEVSTRDGLHECLAIHDISGLLALVQFGVLEFHVWPARKDRLDRPDLLVIDLDPDESLRWPLIVHAGCEVRDRLREIGLESFVKTTGGKGIHVVVPLHRRSGWEDCKRLAELIAGAMIADSPARYTNVSSKRARKGKIYLDCGRMSRGASFVAPYSTRARENASISVPITWDELRTIPNARSITLANVHRRLDFTEDPWSDFDKLSQSVTKKMLKAL